MRKKRTVCFCLLKWFTDYRSSLLCTYTFSDFKLILMGLYRSRLLCTELFSDTLSQLLKCLIEKYSNYVILCAGHININVLLWLKEWNMWSDMLASQNMEYLIDFPKIVTSNSPTAIDRLIKWLNLKLILVEAFLIMMCLSDHDSQTLTNNYPDNIKNNDNLTQ